MGTPPQSLMNVSTNSLLSSNGGVGTNNNNNNPISSMSSAGVNNNNNNSANLLASLLGGNANSLVSLLQLQNQNVPILQLLTNSLKVCSYKKSM